MESEYITTEEMAIIYNVSEETVRRWCKKGKINAKKIDRRWFIKKDEENKDER